MKIDLHEVRVRELCAGYNDLSIQEEGIVGYGGRLNIRPKYQREFVYDEKKRNAVMDTVWQNFPLNVMYWVKTDGADGIEYEVLDGQQRTISICSFIAGEYMMEFDGNLLGFNNMTQEQQNRILDYKLQVYICEGTDEEKIKWFQRINIAGEKLTDQEILNAIYAGSWTTQAKRRFSKTGCVAYRIASDFMSGSPIRQDYFETALQWIGDAQDKSLRQYMADHQHDTDADELWQYFQDVIHWVDKLFGRKYKKEMKGVEWGLLYNKHRDTKLTATAIGGQIEQYMAEHAIKDSDATALWLYFQQVINWVQAKFKYRSVMKGVDWGAIYNKYGSEHINIEEMEQRISALIQDSDVGNQKGIYWYVFDADERHLQIRAFDGNTKRRQHEKQKGVCPICGKHFEIEEMEADHITPWSQGGHTTPDNCQMLCRDCNRRKSSK